MNKVVRKGIWRLIVTQLLLTALMMALFGIFHGIKGAYSALLGGLVCILPNLYFAYKLFRYEGAQAATHILKSFYKGEAIKLLITVALFAVIFKWVPLVPLAFFVTFIVVQWLFWLAPWIFVK